MEEMILFKAKKISVKRFIAVTLIIAVFLSVLWYLLHCFGVYTVYKFEAAAYHLKDAIIENTAPSCAHAVAEMTFFEFVFSKYNSTDIFEHYIIPFLLVILWKGIRYLQYFKCELTVTNFRVFGKTALGKDYSVPLEQLTNIKYCLGKGLKLIYGKQKTAVHGIANRKEARQCIAFALQARAQEQNNTEEQTEIL